MKCLNYVSIKHIHSPHNQHGDCQRLQRLQRERGCLWQFFNSFMTFKPRINVLVHLQYTQSHPSELCIILYWSYRIFRSWRLLGNMGWGHVNKNQAKGKRKRLSTNPSVIYQWQSMNESNQCDFILLITKANLRRFEHRENSDRRDWASLCSNQPRSQEFRCRTNKV